jgi:hypothetical protein
MTRAVSVTQATFDAAFRGNFASLLSWESLTDFWTTLRATADEGWYLYAVGMPLPQAPSTGTDVLTFIDAVDRLLRHDHREDYCGIVYVDSREHPTLIKIFDPNHLGVACGFSKHPPLPGWIMSRIPPTPLHDRRVLPMGRQRWWNALWE